jgi:4-amino-4-deoxy-L-arabinose transferase-like glycosyltransferase
LRDAVFLGVLTPVFIYFSRKIKSDVAFVLFVIFVVLVLFALVRQIHW